MAKFCAGLVGWLCLCWSVSCLAGVKVAYQLPTQGPLPRTYCVTLAIVDAKNPDWIISQFLCGQARTVTQANGGKFEEEWNGLDDNVMPVPPGEYGVKGIYMPAEKWRVDGEYHSVVPQFVAGASSFTPSPGQDQKPQPFGGDPCDSPLGDIATSPAGMAVFYYQYLENGLNNPLIDLNKPVGYEQFVQAYPSGGAAGGTSTTTDGKTIWSFSTDGGAKFVYRADGKRFGKGKGNSRLDVSYQPAGWVTAMANWHDAAADKTCVYVAERGKVIADPARARSSMESTQDSVDKLTILDGVTGEVLGQVAVEKPRGLAVLGQTVYALCATQKGFDVRTAAIKRGLIDANWQTLFTLDGIKEAGGLAVDSHGRVYVSDPSASQVCQFDARGTLLRRYGKPGGQQTNSYDPLALMWPGKLATWTDPKGQDRLLILEHAGPNRVSEWSADGQFIREWLSLQTHANEGYAIDPEHPEDAYVAGQMGWLTRFKIDYAKGTFKVDAVWPDVGNDPDATGLALPRLIRHDGTMYLACGRSGSVQKHSQCTNIYRFDGTRWMLSSSIITENARDKSRKVYFWHDVDGNGKVSPAEYQQTPANEPVGVLKYHGNRWLEDLSYLALQQGTADVWRLVPTGFDEHKNPILGKWEKVLTDPVFVAREKGEADTVHGGNELDTKFSSDWALADGTPAEGYYVQARGGKSFSANEGSQVKISRYVPDGKGGYRLMWRTGRAVLGGVGKPGEIYGAIQLRKPINGLLSIVDQSRCGVLLYTEDGLYVDTLFADGRRFAPTVAGQYVQPGEFFAGDVYGNRQDGQIYVALGKYTPLIFRAVGWSLKDNPVQRLTTVDQRVTIAASQIAAPSELALVLRGGAGSARLARVAPALGGAVLDGSLDGWESVSPVTFQADKDQSVEVRCLYDPEHLYLRWHVRLAGEFAPKALQPIERLFTHDRLADTVSLYFQGDPTAKPGGPSQGRPGDARIVFGLFQDGGKVVPAALGMYPDWPDKQAAHPMVYQTPIGTATFAHVAPVEGAQLNHRMDADNKGFVLTASLPRSAFPRLSAFGADLRTLINFEATLNGHNKFWWANSDGSASRETYDEPTEARLYPGSWAPVQFEGLESGFTVRAWQICGPFGGPGAEKLATNGDQAMKELAQRTYEPASFPPDRQVDIKATYTGPQIEGYWPKPGVVRWVPARVAGTDTRVEMGKGMQVWYAATWVHADSRLTVQCAFQTSQMAHVRWELNGQSVPLGKPVATPDRVETVRQQIVLSPGWNEIRLRGYCLGYPPLRAGVVVLGPTESLWKLRFSGLPPEGGR